MHTFLAFHFPFSISLHKQIGRCGMKYASSTMLECRRMSGQELSDVHPTRRWWTTAGPVMRKSISSFSEFSPIFLNFSDFQGLSSFFWIIPYFPEFDRVDQFCPRLPEFFLHFPNLPYFIRIFPFFFRIWTNFFPALSEFVRIHPYSFHSNSSKKAPLRIIPTESLCQRHRQSHQRRIITTLIRSSIHNHHYVSRHINACDFVYFLRILSFVLSAQAIKFLSRKHSGMLELWHTGIKSSFILFEWIHQRNDCTRDDVLFWGKIFESILNEITKTQNWIKITWKISLESELLKQIL